MIYTIIQSCRRRGINPQDYLTDVLSLLPALKSHEARDLLPSRWMPQSKQRPSASRPSISLTAYGQVAARGSRQGTAASQFQEVTLPGMKSLSSGSLYDYPELHKPLGAPKGAYKRTIPDGWEFTREFEYASV